MDQPDPDTSPERSPTRRRFFRNISLIPVAVVGLPGCADNDARGGATSAASTPAAPYQATFFSRPRWRSSPRPASS